MINMLFAMKRIELIKNGSIYLLVITTGNANPSHKSDLVVGGAPSRQKKPEQRPRFFLSN